ncbi:signal peptidase II [Cohnella terricola]|uniref:Lipoprotein signal peptidase n=1 Tax=Cohnella terricola TaxID=1289167 RepID=A0A559JSY9_9BACL|nr:signal peptidase II [Cohnella terricola]TVY02996.1 signal peptidase II [Cohnella terricola]
MPFYIIAFLVIVADQATKAAVRVHLEVGESARLWGIELTRFENSGMAGSMLQGYGRLFGIVAVLFVLGVLYYRKYGKAKGALLDCGLGFLVGGAVGNGIDRLLFGRVTDFIVRKGGILNVADHAIEIGALLLIVYTVTIWIKGRKPAKP